MTLVSSSLSPCLLVSLSPSHLVTVSPCQLLRTDHRIRLTRIEQFFFSQNKITAVVAGHGKIVAQNDRLHRAGLLTIAAKDTAQQVDFIDLCIAFAWRDWICRV